MKKILFFLAAAAALAACAPKQTAKVEKFLCPHSGELKGLVVTYDALIDEASVAEDTYAVEGPEVARVVVDSNRVILAFKAPKMHECDKAESCEKQEGCEKHEGCEEAEGCEKHEGCEKAEGCEKQEGCDKHEGCEKAEGCEKPEMDCCELPEITVKQVKDIKTVDGKVVKAWKNAVKAL